MTRVAIITGGLPFGGSTTFLCNLGGELVRRKIPVEILSLEGANPMANDFGRLNVPVQCLAERHSIFEDRVKIALQRLSEFQPTVVLANLGAESFEVFRYLPKGVFRIGIGHSDELGAYEMLKHYVFFMDTLAVVSSQMKKRLSAMPEFSRVPIRYLAHGVPMPPEAELPVRSLKAPLQILYLGRLECEQKRVHLFPQILEHLKASLIPFHWTIAGEGSARSFLEASLKSNRPDQSISITGQIHYADVPTLLLRHDICLLTSDYEGFGLSVVEAMGSGLVPVVSDLPAGIPEMVDNTTGILVPVDDVAGYARGMVYLHENRDELATKSAAARQRVVMKFSVEAMADRWLAAFPLPSSTTPVWPNRWRIQAPLIANNPLYFSTPMRIMRRLGVRMRNSARLLPTL